MSERSKDELIEAQNQVIGILFEIIKRFQANGDLDDEYFRLIQENNEGKPSEEKRTSDRLIAIRKEREENSKIISRLLEQLN